MHFPPYLWKPAATGLGELAWGPSVCYLRLYFIKLAYQPLFTPVEKDLWTKEVELCV